MNSLIAIIFLYSIPNIRSHGLAFSEPDILNIVKNLEETIESQEKRIRLLEENCEFMNVLLVVHESNFDF